MKHKKYFELMSVLIMAFVLIISVSLIRSQEDNDFSGIPGLENVNGQGMEIKPNNGNTILTFAVENSNVNINGNSFENIIFQDEAGFPTFIELDSNGSIVEANFKVIDNEEGGEYCFGKTCIAAPPNSLVYFNKKTGIISIEVPEGSTLTKRPWKKEDSQDEVAYVVTIGSKGQEGYYLPSGDYVKGKLHYDRNGRLFMDEFSIVEINNIKISTDSQRYVLFTVGEKEKLGEEISYFLITRDMVGVNGEAIVTFNEEGFYLNLRDGEMELKRNGEYTATISGSSFDFEIFDPKNGEKALDFRSGEGKLRYIPLAYGPGGSNIDLASLSLTPIELTFYDSDGNQFLPGGPVLTRITEERLGGISVKPGGHVLFTQEDGSFSISPRGEVLKSPRITYNSDDQTGLKSTVNDAFANLFRSRFIKSVENGSHCIEDLKNKVKRCSKLKPDG